MEGYVFLWSCWFLFILLTCFYHKHVPAAFIYHLLIVIFLSPFFIPVNIWEVNLAVLYVLGTAVYYCGKLPMKSLIYVVFCCFIIAFAKASYILYGLLEPLWYMWAPEWIGTILLVYLSVMLHKQHMQRMLLFVLGIVISDVLLTYAYARSWLAFQPFSLELLDQLSAGGLFLAVLFSMEQLKQYKWTQYKTTRRKRFNA